MTRETAEPIEAVTAATAPAIATPSAFVAGIVSSPALLRRLARSSPEQRKSVLEGLSATAGNHRVTGMLLRTPGETAAEPEPYPHPLRTERVDAPDGRSFRISQSGQRPDREAQARAEGERGRGLLGRVRGRRQRHDALQRADRRPERQVPLADAAAQGPVQQGDRVLQAASRGGGPGHFEGDWSYIERDRAVGQPQGLQQGDQGRQATGRRRAGRHLPGGSPSVRA